MHRGDLNESVILHIVTLKIILLWKATKQAIALVIEAKPIGYEKPTHVSSSVSM